ncbi:MAG: TonB-dependent receptor, partial [Haliea sp.]
MRARGTFAGKGPLGMKPRILLSKCTSRTVWPAAFQLRPMSVLRPFSGASVGVPKPGKYSWLNDGATKLVPCDACTRQFGSSTTGFAGYGYKITPHWRVHASHGTSFVAPSFNQLYFPGFGTPT